MPRKNAGSNEDTLNGIISLDASVLVELLTGTVASQPLRESIESDRTHPHTTFLALTEAEYILCRKIGGEKAREKVERLIHSRTVELVEDSTLQHDAAEIKCQRAIALGDCYTIALAEKLKGKALFAQKEDDLEREVQRKP